MATRECDNERRGQCHRDEGNESLGRKVQSPRKVQATKVDGERQSKGNTEMREAKAENDELQGRRSGDKAEGVMCQAIRLDFSLAGGLARRNGAGGSKFASRSAAIKSNMTIARPVPHNRNLSPDGRKFDALTITSM
jgi:hypothetical protein